MQIAHDNSQVAMTDIEVQGVAEYMNMDPRTKVIFVLPPSYDVWHERFTRRYGDAPDIAVTKERVEAALREIEHALSVPYYHFLVNDSLPEAVAEAKTIAEGSEAPQRATHAHEIARKLVVRLKAELAGQGRQAAVEPKAQQR
jgi:guanylate kinase